MYAKYARVCGKNNNAKIVLIANELKANPPKVQFGEK